MTERQNIIYSNLHDIPIASKNKRFGKEQLLV